MKIPGTKQKVRIFCIDNTVVKGHIYLPEGLRTLDYLNSVNETFIVMTETEVSNLKEMHSFTMVNELIKRKRTIMINKAGIKWVEEIAK